MDRHDESRDKATGGILGLGGSPVPKEPGDPSAANDPDSRHRRRQRIAEGEVEESTTAVDDHAGATGIDMGAGGHGTDISGR